MIRKKYLACEKQNDDGYTWHRHANMRQSEEKDRHWNTGASYTVVIACDADSPVL
jgi:hypothetical protein